MERAVFSLLVENSSGVLSKISGLFSRRCYNIDSLTVGETMNPKYSRMTVAASGEKETLEQIHKQLDKLIDVKKMVVLPMDNSVCRELILVRIACDVKQRVDAVAVADIFHAKVVDVAIDSMIMELTGAQDKLDAFIDLLEGFEILEIARTGVTGLARGQALQ